MLWRAPTKDEAQADIEKIKTSILLEMACLAEKCRSELLTKAPKRGQKPVVKIGEEKFWGSA